MNRSNFFLIFLALIYAPFSHSWEIRQYIKCPGIFLEVDKFSMCFPEHFYIDVIDSERVGLLSKKTDVQMSFRFESYANNLEKNQENGFLLYEGRRYIGDHLVYMHAISVEGAKLHVFTLALEKNKLYLRITGFSEVEIENTIKELIATITYF